MRKHLEIMSIFSRNGVIQLPGDKLCEKQQLWSYGSLIKIPPSRLYSGEKNLFYIPGAFCMVCGEFLSLTVSNYLGVFVLP